MTALARIRFLLLRRARSTRRISASEEGSALIEFALVAFMFIIVLLGVVEMSRVILVYTSLANAARAGTRYAIVHGQYRTGSGSTGPSGPGNTTQVETVVKNFASTGMLDTTKLNVTVAYPGSSNNVGQAVTVTVTYPYDAIIPFFSTLFGATMGSSSEGVIMF